MILNVFIHICSAKYTSSGSNFYFKYFGFLMAFPNSALIQAITINYPSMPIKTLF